MGFLMWYEWNSIEKFNQWHDALCISLGYPLTPVNQATGEPDETAQKVVAYTNPLEIENKIIAIVEDDKADGLTLTELRPTPPSIT
jgi:hypothetical protein